MAHARSFLIMGQLSSPRSRRPLAPLGLPISPRIPSRGRPPHCLQSYLFWRGRPRPKCPGMATAETFPRSSSSFAHPPVRAPAANINMFGREAERASSLLFWEPKGGEKRSKSPCRGTKIVLFYATAQRHATASSGPAAAAGKG